MLKFGLIIINVFLITPTVIYSPVLANIPYCSDCKIVPLSYLTAPLFLFI